MLDFVVMNKDLKTGAFIITNGQFRVRLKHGVYLPSLTVDFRILSDPSNLRELQDIRDQQDLGHTWASENSAGWVISKADELAKLYARLKPGRALARFALVEAWDDCLELLPRSGHRSTREDREAAFGVYASLARKYPPEHRVLPPDYFKLWV